MNATFLLLTTLLAAQPTAAELVAAYAASTRALDDATFEIHFKDTFSGPIRSDGLCNHEGQYWIAHRGDKWNVRVVSTQRYVDDKNKVLVSREKWEMLLDGKAVLVLQSYDDPQSIIANLDGKPVGDWIGTIHEFTTLFGYFSGNATERVIANLVDVIKDTQLTVTESAHPDPPGWCLTSTGPRGTVRISFAPDLLVKRVRAIKSGHDLWGSKSMADSPSHEPNAWSPGGKTQSFEVRLDIDEYAETKGRAYPVRATVQETSTTTGGTVTQKIDIRIDNVRFGVPDSAFTITTPIPDGAHVQVDDRPNIEYVWHDGEIVKKFNPRAVARLRDRSYFATFSITNYFVVFTVLLLVTLGLLSWVKHRMA